MLLEEVMLKVELPLIKPTLAQNDEKFKRYPVGNTVGVRNYASFGSILLPGEGHAYLNSSKYSLLITVLGLTSDYEFPSPIQLLVCQ